MATSSPQRVGFGAVPIIIVIVLLVAAAGGLVYQRSKMGKEVTATMSPLAVSPAATTSTAKPSLKPAEIAASEYAIPELGIKLTIRNSLNDLTYHIKDIQLSNGATTKAAYFSTKQLAKAEAKCAADSMSIAAMAVGNGQYPVDDENAALDYGPLLKQLPGKFVTFLTSRASCTAGKGVVKEELLSDALADLSESVKTVEQVN